MSGSRFHRNGMLVAETCFAPAGKISSDRPPAITHSLTSQLIHLAVAVAAVMGISSANAAVLSVSDASTIIQSTAADSDFGLLTQIAGFQSGQSVNYSSSSTASGWAGALSGVYLGTALSVAYIGDFSAYPTGPLTWTDTGTYGTKVWSGTGSATIADTSPTTFQVTFMDLLSIGSSSASINSVIPGMVLPDGTIMYGTAMNPEAGPGAAVVDGVAKDIYYSYKNQAGNIVSDVVFMKQGDPLPPRPPEIENAWIKGPIGPIMTVPEPGMVSLAVIGLAGLLSRRQRRRCLGDRNAKKSGRDLLS